jgi:hypothetical protein
MLANLRKRDRTLELKLPRASRQQHFSVRQYYDGLSSGQLVFDALMLLAINKQPRSYFFESEHPHCARLCGGQTR